MKKAVIFILFVVNLFTISQAQTINLEELDIEFTKDSLNLSRIETLIESKYTLSDSVKRFVVDTVLQQENPELISVLLKSEYGKGLLSNSLGFACDSCNNGKIKYFLNNGVNPNSYVSAYFYSKTLLESVISNNCPLSTIELFVENGANIKNTKILNVALSKGARIDENLVSYLLSQGVQVDSTCGINGYKLFRFHQAYYGDDYYDDEEYIYSYDYDYFSRNYGGYTSSSIFIALEGNNTNVIDTLIAHGANLYAVFEGRNAVNHAARFNDTVNLHYLLNKGFKYTLEKKKKNQLQNPVYDAIFTDSPKALDYLIQHAYPLPISNRKLTREINNKFYTPQIIEVILKHTNDSILHYNTLFVDATEYGNVDLIEYFLSENVDVNIPSLDDKTPLMAACQQNNDSLVFELVKRGAYVNYETENRKTAIEYAYYNYKDSTVIEFLKKKGAQFKHFEEGFPNALMYACRSNNEHLVDSIFALPQININQTNKKKTALTIASKYSSFSIMKKIIDAGADIEFKTYNKQRPIHIVINKQDNEKLQYLIQNGAKLNKKATWMRVRPIQMAISERSYDMCKSLIDAGAKIKPKYYEEVLNSCKSDTLLIQLFKSTEEIVTEKDKNENFDLEDIIDCASYEKIESILRTNSKRQNKSYSSKIYESVLKEDRYDVLDLLLEYNISPTNSKYEGIFDGYNIDTLEIQKFYDAGIDINSKNKYGITPVMYAARQGDVHLIKYFQKLGADVNVFSRFGYNIMYYAIDNENLDLITYLDSIGVAIDYKSKKENTLLIGAAKGDKFYSRDTSYFISKKNICEYLIQNGVNKYCVNEYDESAFSEAISTWNIEVVELLLENDSLNNGKFLNYYKILDELTKYTYEEKNQIKQYKITQLLFANGFDVNFVNEDQKSMLELALRAYDDRILEFLLEHGANPNVISKKGESLLEIAIRKGNSNGVSLLLEHGANPNIKTKRGKSLVEITKKKEKNIRSMLIAEINKEVK